LKKFVDDMKSSGFVAASLSRHKIEDAVMAPVTPKIESKSVMAIVYGRHLANGAEPIAEQKSV
jgi:hypothetical protein